MATITISKTGSNYTVNTGYELRNFAKSAGCRWQPDRKVWVTSSADVVSKVIAAAKAAGIIVDVDSLTRADLSAAVSAPVASASVASRDIQIVAPQGRDYLPFQTEGIRFLAQRTSALLADEMGLGKTVQALGVVNTRGYKNVLVIAPKSLVPNWRREAQRWLVGNLTVGVATTSEFPDTDVVVINYDIVERSREAIDARGQWDLVVCDEAHYLKNSKAARTKAVLGSKELSRIAAKSWLFLTGTPVLNRPAELWTLLRVLDPQGLGRNWQEYVTRYCDARHTKWGWDVSGASNLSELETRLRPFMLRRRKADVLADLPAKRRTLVVLPPNGASRAIEAEAKLLETIRERIAQAQAEVEAARGNDESAYREALSKLKKVRFSAISEIAKARHTTGLAKVSAVVDFVNDQEIGKAVIFAWHRDVAEAIANAFGDAAVVVHGESTMDERDAAVTRFQTDETCRVFVGTIAAAGVGLTLTAANTVIFAEMAWTPSLMAQAEDRCHRIGQQNSVSVYNLVYDRTVDAHVARVLVDKESIIDQIMGDDDMLEAALA